MATYDKELMEEAAVVFLSLVPSLAEEIERSLPATSTHVEKDHLRKLKACAEMHLAASRSGVSLTVYARQLITLNEKGVC